MEKDKYFWNYEIEPGRILKNYRKNNFKTEKARVSIITSYYNAKEFMWQTINCVLNQTFPFWEWIIVDDGSTEKESIEYLKEIEKIDKRIKVYHKENEGLAKGRDYGIKKSNTNYILPLDSDDLIEPTYIEILYLALIINKNASWAFTNSVGFGKYIYLVDQEFNCEKMKKENQITVTALIRKDSIINVGGYGKAARYVNEDWHLWLRMMSSGYFPVQISYYGFWYRRRERSLLAEINNKNKKENQLRILEINEQAQKIKKNVIAIIFPKKDERKLVNLENIDLYTEEKYTDKLTIVYILPSLLIDRKLFKKIKKQSISKNVLILIWGKSKYSRYANNRQKLEEFSTVYSLDDFLPSSYNESFIKYLIKTRNVEKIFLADNCIEKSKIIDKFKDIELIKFKENKVKYEIKILKYKFKSLHFIKIIKKIIKKIIMK